MTVQLLSLGSIETAMGAPSSSTSGGIALGNPPKSGGWPPWGPPRGAPKGTPKWAPEAKSDDAGSTREAAINNKTANDV